MKYVYPACFYKEDDGRYSVEVPDFPLSTFGDGLADAIYSVQVTRFRTVLRKR
jgi:predicted RNase H-like HicB family nuclease